MTRSYPKGVYGAAERGFCLFVARTCAGVDVLCFLWVPSRSVQNFLLKKSSLFTFAQNIFGPCDHPNGPKGGGSLL